LSLKASLSSPASSSGVSSDHSSGSSGSSGYTSSRLNRSFEINDKLSRYDGIGYTERNDGKDTSSDMITVSKDIVSSTGGYRTLDRTSSNKKVTSETVNLSTSIVISEDDCSMRKICTLDRGSSLKAAVLLTLSVPSTEVVLRIKMFPPKKTNLMEVLTSETGSV